MTEQSKVKRRRTAAATTLNDLPESILIHILSMLPLFPAIETSFISRKWRNLWHFIPTLEFYLDPPYFSDPEYHLRLVNTITQVLLNRPKSIPLNVFRLAIRYFPKHRHRTLISSWLRYALDCGVEDICLSFDGKGNDEPKNLYDFHFSDLSNRHVKCLCLDLCEIVMPRNVSSRFSFLRVLELARADVVDELLTDLISKCENLEELCLTSFEGVRNFRICSKSLKVLKLLNFYGGAGANREQSSIELCTPNLSKIRVKDVFVATFMGDLSSVNEAELSFFSIFKYTPKCYGSAMDLLSGVENLKIKGFIPSKFESDECFQFRRLKHLELMPVSTLLDVLNVSLLLERSPALETLVFGNVREGERDSDEDEDEDEDDDDDDDEHEEDGASGFFAKLADTTSFLDEKNPSSIRGFHIPSLREVKMKGFRNSMNERMILLLLEKKHKVVLNKVVVVPANIGKATVVLDPTSEELHNFWLHCMTDKLAKAKREVCFLRAPTAHQSKKGAGHLKMSLFCAGDAQPVCA